MIPALNEEESASLVVQRLQRIAEENASYAFDVVVVDDGSTDSTAEVFAKELDAAAFRFVVLQLSRNFGSHAAITAAVDHCASDAAITLSADLQEPTSLVSELLREWEAGHDVVWAVRGNGSMPGGVSPEPPRASARCWRTTPRFPTTRVPGPSQVLLSNAVLEQLRLLREGNRNILGLIAWLGFPQTTIGFQQESRAVGTSRWNNAKRAKLAVDSFIAHSRAPLRVVLVSALVFMVLAVALWIAALVAALTGAGVTGVGIERDDLHSDWGPDRCPERRGGVRLAGWL